jgi:hypothetical protein
MAIPLHSQRRHRASAPPIMPPELASAIERSADPELERTIKPADVALCNLYACDDRDDVDADVREVARAHLEPIRRACEETHGRISRWCYSTSTFAAAVLCDDGEAGVVVGRLPQRLSDQRGLLVEGRELSFEVSHRLRDEDRLLCQDEIFSCLAEALQQVDDAMAAGDLETAGCRPVTELSKDLASARAFMTRCATRRAKGEYVNAMAATAAALAALLLAVALVISLFGTWSPLARQLLLVPLAGATGAGLSVLTRLTSAVDLPGLNMESRRRYIRMLAGIRPVVGALSALALFALLLSPLVPLDRGPSPTAFYVAISVLAGFSERLAPDMFLRAGKTLLGDRGPDGAAKNAQPQPA